MPLVIEKQTKAKNNNSNLARPNWYHRLNPKAMHARDEFGPKFFGPGLKWAMEIMARPGHGPKPMLAFGPGRAWAKFKIDGPGWAGPKFENILKKITFSIVFQFKIAKYDAFHNF